MLHVPQLLGQVHVVLVGVIEALDLLPEKIKISENVAKITTPHYKKLYRFYGNDTGKAIADYISILRASLVR